MIDTRVGLPASHVGTNATPPASTGTGVASPTRGGTAASCCARQMRDVARHMARLTLHLNALLIACFDMMRQIREFQFDWVSTTVTLVTALKTLSWGQIPSIWQQKRLH